MAVLTFKFDESYKPKNMVIGGWIADDKQWKRVEKLWQKSLAFENNSLPPELRVSRYHAAEMNANDGEYKGWKSEGYRKLRLTRKLLKIVSHEHMKAVAAGINLQAWDEIFPLRKPPGYGTAYVLCLKALMNQLGVAMAEHRPDDQLAIIHDHGDWDNLAHDGFYQTVDDVNWKHRHRFVSITPLSSLTDVGLQSADLFAYEALRYLDDHKWEGEDMRKPLKELFRLRQDSAFGFYMDRNYIAALRVELERSGKIEPLTKPIPEI